MLINTEYEETVALVRSAKKEVEDMTGHKLTPEEEKRRQESIEHANNYVPKFDSVYTMEDGPALALYIIVMAVGTIFADRWLIWIAATVIYFTFKNRHKKK